jgi:hypothetical protein
VKATVENTGTVAAENVDWNIKLDSGAFVGSETTGTIEILPDGEITEISSKFILGFGATNITVTACSTQNPNSDTALLFLVLGI